MTGNDNCLLSVISNVGSVVVKMNVLLDISCYCNLIFFWGKKIKIVNLSFNIQLTCKLIMEFGCKEYFHFFIIHYMFVYIFFNQIYSLLFVLSCSSWQKFCNQSVKLILSHIQSILTSFNSWDGSGYVW